MEVNTYFLSIDTVCSMDFYPIKSLYADYLPGVTFPALTIGMMLVKERLNRYTL